MGPCAFHSSLAVSIGPPSEAILKQLLRDLDLHMTEVIECVPFMNILFFITLLSSLILASIWLGKRAAAKTKTHEDYFLMGRGIRVIPLAMTLLATQVGGGALMGAAEEAYVRGWSVLFYPLGMVIGLLALGLGYGAKMRALNLTTVPEIFEKIYGSIRLRKIASLLSIASLFFILVGQAIAARKFFFAIGLNGNVLFILFWSVLIIYTVMGGLRAVVNTDILQAGFILAAFGIACFCTWTQTTSFTAVQTPAVLSQESAPWLTWLLMPFFFMLIEQDMGQRCFAAKNPQTVTVAALLSSLLLLAVSFAPIYFGTLAAKLGIPVEEGSSVLVTSVKAFTNPLIAAVLICAILMAIVSTADSLLCSISSNIACDFTFFKRSLLASRAITCFAGLATLILAFFFNNVVSMLMFSYELSVQVLFVPVTMAVLSKNPHKHAAIASLLAGFACFVLFRIGSPPFPKEILSPLISFAAFACTQRFIKMQKGRTLHADTN